LETSGPLANTDMSTFIIEEEGRIIKVFPKVKVKNHSQEVLAVLEG